MNIVKAAVAHPSSYLWASAGTSAGDQGGVPVSVGPLVLGAVLIAIGGLAFSGVWRGWARSRMCQVYRVMSVAVGWAGVGFLVSGLGGFLPEPMSDFVVIPALVFAGLGLLGMVWLPGPFLPRWYKVEMGMEGGSARNRRAIASASGKARPPLRGPLGADLRGGEETGFGAASRLGGFVGGVAAEAHNGAGPT